MTAAVILHPHPDRGGDQYNNVVTALYGRLPAAGITPHRFDFASSDLATAQAQTIAAIESAGEPVVLLGYSFGGAVAATVVHPAVIGWGLIAPALSLFTASIGADARPKLVVAGAQDTLFAPDLLVAATADWIGTTVATVANSDHFFRGGAADEAAELVADWAERLAALADAPAPTARNAPM